MNICVYPIPLSSSRENESGEPEPSSKALPITVHFVWSAAAVVEPVAAEIVRPVKVVALPVSTGELSIRTIAVSGSFVDEFVSPTANTIPLIKKSTDASPSVSTVYVSVLPAAGTV